MSKKKLIIGLAGKIASGKETVSNHILDHFDAVQYRYSDSLRDVLQMYDLPITRESLQELSKWLRQHFSEDVLARAMVKKTKNSTHQIVIIDGIRRKTDIENFLNLNNFYLIYIEADQNLRFERYVTRNQSEGDKDMNFDDFVEKDSAESESQIESLKESAGFILNNDGSFEELYAQTDKFLRKLTDDQSQN